MQLRSVFALTLYVIILADVDEILAKKRSEAFRRCLKQMKTSFRVCFIKLTEMHERARMPVGEANQTATSQDVGDKNATTTYGALVLRDDASAEERLKIIHQLRNTLAEKVEKMPPGKMKIDLMEKFKMELAKTKRLYPTIVDDPHKETEAAAKLRDTLIERVNQELEQLKQQERMYDPKQRRRILEEKEREELEKEMVVIREQLSFDMENRSKLQFPVENIAHKIRVQVANSTSLKTDLAASTVGLIESRDMLEEIKRTCRECKRIYEVEVSAIIELSNYLLQNVDLQIDMMTDVVRIMNRQPSLLAGTFEFDFTREVVDRNVVEKAAAEIYEMTRCFVEMRKLHYKIKSRDWNRLANRTGALFFRIDSEIAKQHQQFSIAV